MGPVLRNLPRLLNLGATPLAALRALPGPKRWAALGLTLAVIAAAAAGLVGVRLADSGVRLVAAYVPEGVPRTDPASPLWQRARPLEVTLTAQAFAAPALLEPVVPAVTVRAVHDGQWIAFLLEWADPSPDMAATRPDQFRDAAALQFAVEPGRRGGCMGAVGLPTNLWHWKADWQADIDAGFRDVVDAYPNFWIDYYPFAAGDPPYRAPADFAAVDARRYLAGWAANNPLSEPLKVTPVEELSAMGFGTATHRSRQSVLGRGVHEGGRWRVVFSRPMASDDPEAVQFAPGQAAAVAFAVWDGASGNVGGRKQLSADIAMLVANPRGTGRQVAAVAGLLALVTLLAAGARLAARRRGMPGGGARHGA